jgi:hypothetical protein
VSAGTGQKASLRGDRESIRHASSRQARGDSPAGPREISRFLAFCCRSLEDPNRERLKLWQAVVFSGIALVGWLLGGILIAAVAASHRTRDNADRAKIMVQVLPSESRIR